MTINKTKILSSGTCENVGDGPESIVVHVRVDTHRCGEKDDAWILASAFLGCGDDHICAQVQKMADFQYDESDLVAECEYECRFEVSSAFWQKALSDSDILRLVIVEYTEAGDVTDYEFVRDKEFSEKCSWTLPADTINVPDYVETAVRNLKAELKSK
ncbi:hypothetical protein PMX13_01915 [Collinsella aerofaciens]|uniref:hypothetical protein n=1 Tax=Collinsella aerofaciens TaxID=74426 RepID=UPI00189FDD96|nr:hypothetical protein [Collinsella aerofaciens]MDB1859243.1 hypothetical protein [Collinsella aerofaciens]